MSICLFFRTHFCSIFATVVGYFYLFDVCGMADPCEKVMARWDHIHSYLFPWMREEFDPCSEALQRLIIVLDTIDLGGCGRRASCWPPRT